MWNKIKWWAIGTYVVVTGNTVKLKNDITLTAVEITPAIKRYRDIKCSILNMHTWGLWGYKEGDQPIIRRCTHCNSEMRQYYDN